MTDTGYGASFLKRYGQQCTVERSPAVTSYVSLKRTSQSSDPSIRDAVFQGLILASSSLVSGDIFTVGGDSYLVQSVSPDAVSGELVWYALKCNATITHQRYTETYDDDGNLEEQSWVTLATCRAWGQIVTAKLRAEDPGLVDSARYLFQLPKSLGVQVLDRIIYGGTNYRVEAVDDIAMAGVVRVQLGVDLR